MGTFLAVSAPSSWARRENGPVRAAFDIAAHAERIMSCHDPESHVSRLNRRDRAGLHSRELAPVVRTARDLARRLQGAFDPTVTPLLDVWRMAARRRRLPHESELQDALAHVGAAGLLVTGDHIAFAQPGMSLDLGALGKGLALDQISAMLRQAECPPMFINFGESSLVAIGQPPRDHWRVVLRHPCGRFAGEFPLRDHACSTSATLGQTMRVNGCVLSHILDPRTGRPVSHIAQVTVLARSAAVAEAVSTALLVLGRGAIDQVSHQMNVDVCWVDGTGIYTTPWFPLTRFV
jgi:thiamine biosynthesis lipoprotein